PPAADRDAPVLRAQAGCESRLQPSRPEPGGEFVAWPSRPCPARAGRPCYTPSPVLPSHTIPPARGTLVRRRRGSTHQPGALAFRTAPLNPALSHWERVQPRYKPGTWVTDRTGEMGNTICSRYREEEPGDVVESASC